MNVHEAHFVNVVILLHAFHFQLVFHLENPQATFPRGWGEFDFGGRTLSEILNGIW